MPNISALDRLKSQLQTTGLQQNNIQLYQIISQLIDFQRQNIDSTVSGLASINAAVSAIPPTSISIPTNIVQGNFIPLDGQDGEDGIGTIGKDGISGINVMGPPGIPGISILGIDGEDGEDGLTIPGPPGPAGIGGGGGGAGDVVGPAGATDGNIAVFDGATGKLIKDGGAGGGGGVLASDIILTGTYVGRPVAGTIGRLYFATDVHQIFRDTGVIWESWGPIEKLTIPQLGDFAWVNQGTASAVQGAHGITLSALAAAGDNLKILCKVTPARPYTITVLIRSQIYPINYCQCGMVWRESASGKLSLFGNTWANGFIFDFAKFTNPAAWNSSYGQINRVPYDQYYIRFEEQAGAGNRIMSWSMDGVQFDVLNTIGRTDFLTPDQIGFYVSATNATHPSAISVLSWVET